MRRSTTMVAALGALAALLAASCAADDADADAVSALAGSEEPADAAETEEQEPDGAATDAGHEHAVGPDPNVTPELAEQVAAMREATARYANDLDAALDDGFFIITQHITDMGHHFLNPEVEEFDLADPPILVYARDGDNWQLVALEWVFPEEPDEPPMDGATYGDFPAACHYDDGLFIPEDDEDACSAEHPDSGAAFTFWHDDLVTFHVWAWMHNPDGLYHGTNPLMQAHNE